MEDKFYYVKSKNNGYGSRTWSNVIRYNKGLNVEVSEDIEFAQRINIDISKLGLDSILTPTSQSYQTVKPIIKENFYEYYYLALKYIGEIDFSEGEFYFGKIFGTGYNISWFNSEDKQKKSFDLIVYDTIEASDIRIDSSNGWKDRNTKRKKGVAISIELFNSLIKLSLRFLFDPENYKINLAEFIKSFCSSLETSTIATILPIHMEQSILNITHTIETRIAALEKRLIESDNDSADERTNVRGEIAGLKFSLKVIASA